MRKVLYILGQLNDDDIDWMTKEGERRKIPAGTILIREGHPVDTLAIVLDGELSVVLEGAGGRVIATLGSGEIVGEVSFADSRPPSATVKAASEAIIWSVSKEKLLAELAANTGFAARFYRAVAVFLADRLRSTVGQLGYGKAGSNQPDEDLGEALDIDVLDNVYLAGARFERMLQRLMGGTVTLR